MTRRDRPLHVLHVWVGISVLGNAEAPQALKRRGLVLQFDDGWTEWRTQLAPELARWSGKATASVNNKYLASGRITMADLRILRDEFDWESAVIPTTIIMPHVLSAHLGWSTGSNKN